MKAFLFALLGLAAGAMAAGNTWVVLVAGSNGYGNYRHQSDVCHAYQIFKARGIPDSQIIVMMYDDIANSPSNPHKGQIYNDYAHKDVYAGVPKDYVGNAVTAANFIKVINGIDPGVGTHKILKSGPNDKVFIFFDDHGGDGLLAFPVGPYLYKAELATALNTMYTKQLYGQAIFYVEACEAGSMFYDVKLPPSMYIVTASPILASSYAWQYDSYVNAYLSDIFSQAYINDTDAGNKGEIFQTQYEYTTTHIDNSSQPCQYGDLSLAKLLIDDYFGPKRLHRPMPKDPVSITTEEVTSAYLAPLETARHQMIDTPNEKTIANFNYEQTIKARVDMALEHILVAGGMTTLGAASVPCPGCTPGCKCLQGCGGGAACQFECCNIKSCTERPSLNGARGTACSYTLVQSWQNLCGNDHPYLRSGDEILSRACRIRAGANFNLAAALETMQQECAVNFI